RQREDLNLAFETRHFMMHVLIVAVAFHLTLNDLGVERTRIGYLEIGPAFLGLERLKRRVVPTALIGGLETCLVQFIERLREGNHATEFGGEAGKPFALCWRDHGKDGIAILREQVAELRVKAGETAVHRGQEI